MSYTLRKHAVERLGEVTRRVLDQPQSYPDRSRRRSSWPAAACYDAFVVGKHGTGKAMMLTCKHVDKDLQPVGEPFDVGVYRWVCEDWEEADPPIAIGDIVPIARVMPTGDWILLLRITGTCAGA